MGVRHDGRTAVRTRVRTTLAAISADAGGAISITWSGEENPDIRAQSRRAEGHFRMGEPQRRLVGNANKAVTVPGICFVNLLEPGEGGVGKLEKAADEVVAAFTAGMAAVSNVRYLDSNWDYIGRVAGGADGDQGTYHQIQVTIPFQLYSDG